MTEAHRATLAINGAKLAIAGLTAVGAVLAAAGQATADPVVPDPAPAPADPAMAAPPPPAPAGPPQVPEIANPVYGSGQYGSGPIGTLRDLWHQAHDPGGFQTGGERPRASRHLLVQVRLRRCRPATSRSTLRAPRRRSRRRPPVAVRPVRRCHRATTR